MDPILVTGGTGTLGRHVVRRLNDAGHNVRVLTRHAESGAEGGRFLTGDLLADSGVDAAVGGVATIVHCAGSGSGDDVATQNLVRAAVRSGQPHLVFVSVVGADRIPAGGRIDRTMFGYYPMKRRAEEVITDSGLPWTTLRATQFYDLILKLVQALAKSPVVPFPTGFASQPVDADEVAARLVALALGQPAGLVGDFAGPRVHGLDELIRIYLAHTNRRRLFLPIRLPGEAARAIRNGALLAPEHAVGVKTWDAFLTERLA